MKIWYQSAASLHNLSSYSTTLESHAKAAAAPHTVDIFGTPPGVHTSRNPKDHVGYSYLQTLHAEQFIGAALRAEREGYDAYFVGTIPDIGYEDIRTLVDIPVVAFGHASYLFAAMLGNVIGIVNFVDAVNPLLRRNALKYGFSDMLGPIVNIETTLDSVASSYDKPDGMISSFKVAARTAIAQGADVIIPGPGPLNVMLAGQGINEIDGVPIVDSVGVGMKFCVMRAEMKTPTSRRGYYNAKPPMEIVEELRSLYFKGV